MTTPTDHSRPFAYRFVVAVLRPLLMVLTRREWSGAEHLPREGGFVAVTNHYSHLDPFVFGHFLVDHGYSPRYLGKVEVFRIPVVGWIVRKADQIPVHRESGRAADAYRSAVDAVRAGKTVAIYPEGTLTRDPGLWPMRGKTGAARVALETQCPVVPVATWGAHEVLAPYGKAVRLLPRKTMRVRAGRPGAARRPPRAARSPTRCSPRRRRASWPRSPASSSCCAARRRPPDRFDPRAHGVTPIGKPRPMKEAS